MSRRDPELADTYRQIRTVDGSPFRAKYLASSLVESILDDDKPSYDLLIGSLRTQTPKHNLIEILRAIRGYDLSLGDRNSRRALWELAQSDDEDVRLEAAKTIGSNVRNGFDFLLRQYEMESDNDIKKTIKKAAHRTMERGVTTWQSMTLFGS